MSVENPFYRKAFISVLSASIALVLVSAPGVLAQYVPDSAISKQEQARSIEREIASLEQKLAQANRDKIAMSKKLEEVEKRIVNCYLEIDAAEAEFANSKRRFNNKLRYLYVEGRRDTLALLMSSEDVSDFLVHLDNMVDVTSREADALNDIRLKKEKVEKYQDRLIEFKKEAAALNKGNDVHALEAQVAQKKDQLADVTSEIIAMQLPAAQAPAPSAFSPSQVYSEPDQSGFVSTGQVFSGYSSWYGNQFHGRPTASGEIFDQYAFTCAHKQLPFGTWLKVTFRGRTVIVKVNDRGPFIKGRMLDLSRGSAEAIGLSGVQWVDCEIVVPKS